MKFNMNMFFCCSTFSAAAKLKSNSARQHVPPHFISADTNMTFGYLMYAEAALPLRIHAQTRLRCTFVYIRKRQIKYGVQRAHHAAALTDDKGELSEMSKDKAVAICLNLSDSNGMARNWRPHVRQERTCCCVSRHVASSRC